MVQLFIAFIMEKFPYTRLLNEFCLFLNEEYIECLCNKFYLCTPLAIEPQNHILPTNPRQIFTSHFSIVAKQSQIFTSPKFHKIIYFCLIRETSCSVKVKLSDYTHAHFLGIYDPGQQHHGMYIMPSLLMDFTLYIPIPLISPSPRLYPLPLGPPPQNKIKFKSITQIKQVSVWKL